MPQLYFRAFRTRGVYVNSKAFRREVNKDFQTIVGPELTNEHLKTVSHWKKQPTFEASYTMDIYGIKVFVSPKGGPAKLWTWHSEGVPGRTIRPHRHRQPMMHYRAKGRTPRVKGRERGRRPRHAALKFIGRSGEAVFRRTVEWKGIVARRYPQAIATRYNKRFRKVMENAVRRGASAAQKEGK